MSGNFCHKAATYHKFLKKYPASVKLQHQISTQGKLQKLNKHLLLLRAFIQYTPLARGGGGEGGGGGGGGGGGAYSKKLMLLGS